METLSACPACLHAGAHTYLQCQDWLVTKEMFTLERCEACQLVFTNPRPAEAEIGPYYASDAYVSHTNTNQGLINTAYQLVRGITLKQKRAMLNRLQPDKGGLLDVGCATGHFLESCRADGWPVAGTEPDGGARSQARAKGLDVKESVFEVAGNTFSVITMWHVLEHVHRLRTTLEHLGALLKTGGNLIIAVPNHLSADARRYGAAWAAYDVPRHLYHFSPSSLRPLVEGFGFRLRQQKGMPMDAFYVAMLSERNRGGSLPAAMVAGAKSNLAARGTGQYSSITYVFEKL